MYIPVYGYMDLGRLESRIRAVRKGQAMVDGRQDGQLQALEYEVACLKFYLLSVTGMLVEKGVLSKDQVDRIAQTVASSETPSSATPDPTSDGITPELCGEAPENTESKTETPQEPAAPADLRICPACGVKGRPTTPVCTACGHSFA